MPTNPAQLPQETKSTQEAQEAEYYRHVLHIVIDINVNLARVLNLQVQAHAEPDSPDAPPLRELIEVAASLNDTSRTIRKCILVARKAAEPIKAAPDPEQRRIAAKQRIIRQVEDKIHRHAFDEREGESLNAELQERLDRPDLDDEIDNRPVAEIIADLCRDFGLEAVPGNDPWKRRTPEDIEILVARAAAPRAKRAAPPALVPADTHHAVHATGTTGPQWPGAPRFRGGP